MDEKRYTLAEAQAELRRRGCANHGHEYNILRRFDGNPIRLVCENCGKGWRVEDV